MSKELIIMRGLSGSGKSTAAKAMVGEGAIFSADDYFEVDGGGYEWSADALFAAHNWNYERTKKAMDSGLSPVILDNTNVSLYDLKALKPLVQYAQRLGYEVRIEQANTSWAFNPEELAKRNSHNMSQEDIEKRMRRWVQDPTIDEILDNFEERGNRRIGPPKI